MPIQRSQSAPQPIEALFNVTPLTKSKATRAPEKEIAVARVKLMRSKSYAVDHSSSSSSASNPWAAREDPFSLGGFFSDRVALDEQKQWGWIHGDEDSEEIDFTRPALDAEESLERLGDEQAEKAISAEDKYGLLSLGSIFTSVTTYPDDRLLSPYSEGEAVDHDSLYLALCSRREASTHTPHSYSDAQSSSLFFPAKSDENEVAVKSSWGPSAIFGRVF